MDTSVVSEKAQLVHQLSKTLELFFQIRNFSQEIENIEIGFLMVLNHPGYENWYKPKRPRYYKYKVVNSTVTHESIVYEKLFTYEVRLSESKMFEFIGGTSIHSKKIIAHEILNSLSNFDYLIKKVKDFDIDRFSKDLKTCFIDAGLI